MKISKEKLYKNRIKILLYLLLFILLIGVANSKVYYTGLAPFGISLVLSLLFIKLNGYILSFEYFLSGLIVSGSLKLIGFNLVVSLILAGVYFITLYRKTLLKKYHIFLVSVLIFVIYIGINFSSGKENVALLVSVILALLFLYSCLIFFDALVNRRLMNKLNIDEKFAGGVLLIVFTIGVSCIHISHINIGLIFVSLLSLILVYVVNPSVLLVMSTLMGISFSITNVNLMYVSLFIILSVIGLSFKCNYKIFSAIGYLGGYIITFIIFNMGVSYGDIISVLIGCGVFVLIPYRVLVYMSEYFDIKSNTIVRNIIDRNKIKLVERVDKLSKIFEEMTDVYRGMVKGSLDDNDAMSLLKEEIISSVCDRCENKNNCFRRSGSFIEHSIEVLVDVGYTKGKVLLIDLPSSISTNCIKVNELMGVANNLLSSYRDYSNAISNLDTSRILIADQLYGVSKLLGSLSDEVNININFDNTFENRIKEDLSYKNIICLDCVVYEKDHDTKVVDLIIKKDTLNIKIIERVVSKIIGIHLMVVAVNEDDINDACVVNMCVRPNYDIVFGSAVITKMGKKICGDNHSIVKIDNGKYMVSICDGMGSGQKANKISSLSISLIEKFYKAGFENDIILSTVNKLLSLTEEENFSTIDLCVIDCNKNTYDFIKLGATNGYIKRKNKEIETIKSSNLPVGVLEEISPHITKRLISPFDILVFMSDGVSDVFEKKINFENFLYGLEDVNPQTLSEKILNKAMELSGNIANDDMTVVCVRVFEWV